MDFMLLIKHMFNLKYLNNLYQSAQIFEENLQCSTKVIYKFMSISILLPNLTLLD